MKIINCEQGSETWELMRMVRPTASNFSRIITAKTVKLSASHRDYACELIAKQIGVYTDPPPSYWMQWGIENESTAIEEYCSTHSKEAERVGFVLPDHTDAYGGSPDALVDNRKGLLEVKCPKPETLIKYHWDGNLPDEYRAQVQGLLLITGCEWCDFWAWHPEMAPFHIRVEPDDEYQEKLEDALMKFSDAVQELSNKVSKSGVNIIKWGE